MLVNKFIQENLVNFVKTFVKNLLGFLFRIAWI